MASTILSRVEVGRLFSIWFRTDRRNMKPTTTPARNRNMLLSSSVDRFGAGEVQELSATGVVDAAATEIGPSVLLVRVAAVEPQHLVEVRDGARPVTIHEIAHLLENFLGLSSRRENDLVEVVRSPRSPVHGGTRLRRTLRRGSRVVGRTGGEGRTRSRTPSRRP